jgi:exoribonuclease-2
MRESPPELVITRDEYDPVTSREQKRRMTREHLQVSPDRHGVLGLEQLAVVEDSVDRYPDLLVHQQLIHFLQYRETIYSTEELKQALLYTRWARDTVHQVERSSRRYWLLRYMEQFIGKEVEAVVLERARSGYLVELCETLLWVFMRTRPDVHLSIGTRIWVSVMHVSARRDEFCVANPRPVES